MSREPEVLITGVGVVSPIGIGKQAYWSALLDGQSGIDRIARWDSRRLEVPIGGELKAFDPKAFVRPRKSLKVMCREIQTGFSASAMAMDDAGLSVGQTEPERFGVVFGSEMLFSDPDEFTDPMRAATDEAGQFDIDLWGQRGIQRMYPLWMLMYLPNMAACHLAIAYDAQGPNNSVTVGEASSLLALAEAADVIRRGQADVMIVGGAGSRLNLSAQLYRSTANLTRQCNTPVAACRPFDAARDGMVNGEGAAAVILESAEHARRRGVRPYARLAGVGRSFESRESRWTGRGVRTALRKAVEQASLQPADISHINAHGVSTIEDDRAEAQAIRQVLGDVPVTALKSYFGNLGAGGGTVELIASLLALREELVPATLNYEQPDPECPVQVIAGQPLPRPQPFAVVMNHSGPGQTISVVLERAES